ncbi:DNA-binding protein [Streptomyces sp. NPDC058691]|uniref:DNA-binding protein n=1 Tax=Streptomyces sp. NPDC058691 TaxID=3346601 RepID=UPI0036478EDE
MFRVAPLAGETTWSLISRVAACYALDPAAVLGYWQWGNHRPRHEGGGLRADAEALLDAAGRQVLAGLCGVGEEDLARALPAFRSEDPRLAASNAGPEAGSGQGLWRSGGTVAGPVAFGCGLCAARRTGTAGVRVVRYVPRWDRVCVRHGRWLLDADADLSAGGGEGLEFLDLRELPEVVAARRRWAGVARRAVRAGLGAGQVFGVAHAVVARWWEQALHWEREEIWPRRLHQVAGGSVSEAAGGLGWWRAVGRDAVVFPEVVSVAEALLDPSMSELVWLDSGGERPRLLSADGAFCRRLGERVGRPWLGPVVAVDYGGPLTGWMGAVIRRRRRPGMDPDQLGDDPWRVRQESQPATIAAQLRVLAKEKKAPGSGTMWRSAVPAEQRALITSLIQGAEEQLIQLRRVQTGSSAEVARRLLRNLSHGADLLDQALQQATSAALNAGVPAQDVAQWASPPGKRQGRGLH